jgi:hypothetical protein
LTVIRQSNYRSGILGSERAQSRLIGFLMPAEAEPWGLRTNFTEPGLSAISDVANRSIGLLALDGTSETAFANPPLTAVEISWYDMLAMGTRLLIDLIEHSSLVEQIGVRFSTRLVVRKSTQSKQPSDEHDSSRRRV